METKEEELSHGSASEETDKYEEEANPFPLPDKVGYEEELRPKEGVKKKILEVGEGAEKPQSPDLVVISYKGYFTKSSEVFDSGEGVEVSLDNPELLEGFKIALESMRKNEKSVFSVKSKYAFKKVAAPKGFEERQEEVKKKSVTYEIKLLDFKKRADVNNDGMMMKTFIRAGRGYRSPKELDEVKVTYEITQDANKTIIKRENAIVSLRPSELGTTLCTLLESMKVAELSICNIKSEYYTKSDTMLSNINPTKDLCIKAELHEFITVDDFYNDKSTLKKILRSGKVATAPGMDSSVEFRAKIIVNDEVRFSNLKLKGRLSEKKWEFAKISETEDGKTTTLEPLRYRLDEHKLPPLLTKTLKEMNVKEIAEIDTDKISKLSAYFPDATFNMELFKDAKRVRIYMYLVSAEKMESFATMKIKEKHTRLLHIKEIATDLFKAGHIKKACKLYQRINAFYNFGDVDNLAEGESKDSEEYKNTLTELMPIKKQCFINTTICKYKLKDYDGTITVADQTLGIDPACVKALYWKAKALLMKQEFDAAFESIKQAAKLEPNNGAVKAACEEIKLAREKFRNEEKKKFAKLFK